MIAWLKKKWKIVTGAIVGLIVALGAMLRIRGQKGILENANRAHDEENKANGKARNDLVDGLTDIANDKSDKIETTLENADSDKEALEEKKENLAKDIVESDDLAKDLADLLDVEFVDADGQ